MDRTGYIILIACFVLLLAWGPLVDSVISPVDQRPVPQAPPSADPVEPQPETSRSVEDPAITLLEPEMPGTFEQETASLETGNAVYWFGNRDGGIRRIDLKHYPNDPSLEENGEGNRAMLNHLAERSLASLKMDQTWIRGFEMTREAESISMRRQLESGILVTKTFTPAEDYMVRIRTRIENTTENILGLPQREWLVGTASPMTTSDDGMLMEFMYMTTSDTEKQGRNWFENRTLGCFAGTPRFLFSGEELPVRWGSVENQFFAIALMPEGGSVADGIRSAWVDLALPEEERVLWEVSRGFETSLVWKPRSLQPGEAIEEEFLLYGGPKKYELLSNLDMELQNGVVEIMGFGGFFGFFAKALLLSMNGLHAMGMSYGLTIVVITIIIKLLFWPLTHASTRSMKRMAALQPQMKEIQEKYKDNPQKMNKKLMEFMRRNRVSPLGGCLPILLQLPVFFGFFKMLQSAIELRGAGFLWTADLSKPDTLFVIPGIEIPFNLWPLLMGAAQIWQMKLTPASPGMDPTQQKILKFMPIIFVFILYNFSAGLALYWTVQNLLTIVQTKLTKHVPVTPVAASESSGASPSRKSGRAGRRNRTGN